MCRSSRIMSRDNSEILTILASCSRIIPFLRPDQDLRNLIALSGECPMKVDFVNLDALLVEVESVFRFSHVSGKVWASNSIRKSADCEPRRGTFFSLSVGLNY